MGLSQHLEKKLANEDNNQVDVVKKDRFEMCRASTSTKKSSKDDWYFDSGCSRHMICNKMFLINYKKCSVE